MPDNAAVGFWVRRFLSDHLIHERGVSRNTQQSYRDTFCLFLASTNSDWLRRALHSLSLSSTNCSGRDS